VPKRLKNGSQVLNNGRVLPPPGKRRPELVVEFVCAGCGKVQATHDLNDSPHFAPHVHRGEKIPPEKIAACRAYFARLAPIENCECGARTVFEPHEDSKEPHGLRGVRRDLPKRDAQGHEIKAKVARRE
jgi:hypothetical protein